MNLKTFRVGVLSAAFASSLAGCDQISLASDKGSLPACEIEEAVETWAVAARLEKTEGGEIAEFWEARRNFSTFFGLRVTYDSKADPAPSLLIWHDYKSGEFVMRLDDNAHFRMLLDARYAVTSGTLPPGVFELISRKPVRIEHTSHTNKWSVYETDGLPAAIAAATAALGSLKKRSADGECA